MGVKQIDNNDTRNRKSRLEDPAKLPYRYNKTAVQYCIATFLILTLHYIVNDRVLLAPL